MKGNPQKKPVIIAIGVGASLLAIAAHAAISEVIAVGSIAHFDLFGSPAAVTVRRLTIASGEVLGWHYHPGVGAYTIVTRGRLFVEDGCGGEEVFTAGQAFLEHPNRVHRGKNQDVEPTETVQTFVVPNGLPISVSTPQLCGPPAVAQDCRGNEWMKFSHPQRFRNQGECVFYVAAREGR